MLGRQNPPFRNNSIVTGFDRIVTETGFSKAGTVITGNAAWKWIFDNNTYSNPAAVAMNFPLAPAGKKRIDLICLNKANSFVRVPGQETSGDAFAPAVPEYMIFASFVSVTDTTVSSPTPPQVGVNYKTRDEDGEYLQALDAQSTYVSVNTKATYRFTNSCPVIKAVANYTTNSPMYDGRLITFINSQATDLKLVYMDSTLPGVIYMKFFFKDANDLILHPGDVAVMKWSVWKNRFELVSINRKKSQDDIIYSSFTNYSVTVNPADSTTVFTSNTPVSYYLLNDDEVYIPYGQRWDIIQGGDGRITINAGEDVEILSDSSLTSARKGTVFSIRKISQNTYSVSASGQEMPQLDAPYLDELIPESFQPNATANFRLLGAYFTRNMVVTFGGGAVINFMTFKSDNEVLVNVTTGSEEGSFSVTLDNGTSATFNEVLIITYGEVSIPGPNDFNLLVGAADLSEPGEVKIASDQGMGKVQFFNVPAGQDFQLRFKAKRSPISSSTYTDANDQVSIIEDGQERYRLRYAYAPAILFPSQASTGINLVQQIPVGNYPYNGAVNLDAQNEFYYERIGTTMYVKMKNVVVAQFNDASVGSIIFEIKVQHFDIGSIKLIKL